MKTVRKLLLALAVLAVAFVVVGLLLPRQVHIERSTRIDATPAQVYAMVDGFRRFNEWSPWAGLDPDTRYEFSGPERGVGARMVWQSDSPEVGSGAQQIIAAEADRSVTTRLEFEGQGEAQAAMRLEPDGGGTRATWSFGMDLGMNPVTRWIGLMIEGPVGADYERGLASLKALAEREASEAEADAPTEPEPEPAA